MTHKIILNNKGIFFDLRWLATIDLDKALQAVKRWKQTSNYRVEISRILMRKRNPFLKILFFQNSYKIIITVAQKSFRIRWCARKAKDINSKTVWFLYRAYAFGRLLTTHKAIDPPITKHTWESLRNYPDVKITIKPIVKKPTYCPMREFCIETCKKRDWETCRWYRLLKRTPLEKRKQIKEYIKKLI